MMKMEILSSKKWERTSKKNGEEKERAGERKEKARGMIWYLIQLQ